MEREREAGIADNLWSDFNCPSCKQDLREIQPKLLPCLHSLCSTCLQNTSSNSGSVMRCPACHQDCNLNDIIDNQFINEMQQEKAEDDNAVHTCTSCEDNAAATSFCSDCSEWLCDACVHAHQRVRITKDHIVQTKEEAMGLLNTNPSSKMLFCTIHKQEQLKLFCENCDQLTCRDCQLIAHRDHRYQFVSEVSQQFKMILTNGLTKLREKKSHIEVAKSLVSKRYKDIAEREQMVTNEIKMFSIRFITEINRRGKQLLSELHEICSQKKTNLSQKTAELLNTVSQMDYALHAIEYIIKSGSDTAILYSKRSITNLLKRLLQSRCEVPNPSHVVDIRFVYENAFLSQYINQFGSLMVDNIPYQQSRTIPPQQMMMQTGQSNISTNTQAASFTPPNITSRSQGQPIPNNFRLTQVPGTPHVSSSTHPMGMPKSDHLKQLLETSARPGMPTTSTSQGSGFFRSPGPTPQNSRTGSSLIQNNPSLTRMLFQNGQPHPNTVQGWSSPTEQVTSNSGQNNNLSCTPAVKPPPPYSSRFMSGGVLTLGNTHRLSHFPGQDLNIASPSSSHTSPGGIPLSTHRPSATVSAAIASSWLNGPQSEVLPVSRGDNAIPQDRTVNSSIMVKQEGMSSAMLPSCSLANVSIKQEKLDVEQEISNTACEAMKSFLTDTSLITMIDSFDSSKTLGEMNQNKNDDSASKEKQNTIQQADSSCSPGLVIIDTVGNNSNSCTDNLKSIGGLKTTDVGGLQKSSLTSPKCDDSVDDPNEDWCAVCHDGGTLLCCGRCPRVYHPQCHVPSLKDYPQEEEKWQCLMCQDVNTLSLYIHKESQDVGCKRKNPVGLNGHDLRACQRILLELFCHPNSTAFHEPVSRTLVPDYYKIISNPMDFTSIKQKLSPSHYCHYEDPTDFIQDVQLVFQNCYTFNPEESDVYKDGKLLEETFEELINKFLRDYAKFLTDSKTSSEQPSKKLKVNESAIHYW